MDYEITKHGKGYYAAWCGTNYPDNRLVGVAITRYGARHLIRRDVKDRQLSRNRQVIETIKGKDTDNA